MQQLFYNKFFTSYFNAILITIVISVVLYYGFVFQLHIIVSGYLIPFPYSSVHSVYHSLDTNILTIPL